MRWKLVTDALRYGVFYAVAKSIIESPAPIDGPKTWEFWTKDRNRLVRYLAERYPPQFLVNRFIDRISDDRNIADIIKHYDVPSEFFMLFLDKNYHFYSCGEFRSPDDSLEQAQINKAEHFLSLIDPQPGHRLLELGCGWGAMMKFLHEKLGDSVAVEGITVSQNQADFIKQSCGFGVEVGNFITREYPVSHYDRIYSVEAWEHVRPKDVAPLLKKLHGALKPGGRLVQQFGCTTRPRFPATFLINELIFAGNAAKTLAVELAAAEEAGFRLLHDDATLDYKQTALAYYDRLTAHRDEAVQLVGVREFNRFLLFIVLSWRISHEQYATVHRLTLEKPASG